MTPWTVAHQVPLSMGVSRQEYWRGLPCPSPGDLPDLGIKPVSLVALALQVDSLTLSYWGSPLTSLVNTNSTWFLPQVSLVRGLGSFSEPIFQVQLPVLRRNPEDPGRRLSLGDGLYPASMLGREGRKETGRTLAPPGPFSSKCQQVLCTARAL